MVVSDSKYEFCNLHARATNKITSAPLPIQAALSPSPRDDGQISYFRRIAEPGRETT